MPCYSRIILTALGLTGVGSTLLAQSSSHAPRVILLTLDGVRPTEFFGGMDSTVVAFHDSSGIGDSARVWRGYWRGSAVARRKAAMPFFWDSLAPNGLVVGDRSI